MLKRKSGTQSVMSCLPEQIPQGNNGNVFSRKKQSYLYALVANKVSPSLDLLKNPWAPSPRLPPFQSGHLDPARYPFGMYEYKKNFLYCTRALKCLLSKDPFSSKDCLHSHISFLLCGSTHPTTLHWILWKRSPLFCTV